jgi:undecaprenyl diphosphate synthase
MSEQPPHPLRHIAIIMDGNNRWARSRDLPSIAGHKAGAERLEEIVNACREIKLECLTVFAFSSENWKRPKQEVGGIMSLFATTLKKYRRELVNQDVRLRIIGRRDRLSDRLNKLIDSVESDTAGGKYQLNIAADYGGRWDIAQTAQVLAEQVKQGDLDPSEIDENLLSKYLSTANSPDPDLLIRTGAECRISNFLLWQLSYAELHFSNCYWPDFDKPKFFQAIEEYYQRQRRFGTNPQSALPELNLASGRR